MSPKGEAKLTPVAELGDVETDNQEPFGSRKSLLNCGGNQAARAAQRPLTFRRQQRCIFQSQTRGKGHRVHPTAKLPPRFVKNETVEVVNRVALRSEKLNDW